MTRSRPLALVVDDEPILLRLLEVNLRAAGFDVRAASSGAAAIRAAEAEAPDAVVLDLGLPDIGGWEVLDRMRADDRLSATPVIVLSGTDEDEAAGRGYAATVHAFLTKPVEPALLVETVRRAVAPAEA